MDLMDVRFLGAWHGKRFYRVIRDGRPIFTGTIGECRRFMSLHTEKREKERSHGAPRRRKHQVRTFKVASRRSGSW